MAEHSPRSLVLRSAAGPVPPGQFREAHTPVVVWTGRPAAWRPGLVLGWYRRGQRWEVLVRYRCADRDADREEWVVYDSRLILPVALAPGDVRWWLPEAPDGVDY